MAQWVAPKQLNDAFGGRDQPERHAQRGRLAGAVGTEEAIHVAALDVEVDAIDCQYVLVALYEAPGLHRLGLGVGHPTSLARTPLSMPV